MRNALYYTEGYRDSKVYNIYCTCGNTYEEKQFSGVCPKCKSNIRGEYWGYRPKDNVTIRFYKYINYSEDKSHFEIHMISESYIFNDNKLNLKSEGKPYKLIINFKTDEYCIVNTKGEKDDITEGKMRYFLKDEKLFRNTLKENTNKNLINIIEYFGERISTWGYSLPKGFHNFFLNIKSNKKIQIIINGGLDCYILRDCIEYGTISNTIDINENKLHKILKINKRYLELIKENLLGQIGLKRIQEICLKLDRLNTNDYNYLINIIKEEVDAPNIEHFLRNTNAYLELIDKYNYNPQKLMKYLARDIKLEQGISSLVEGAMLLKDLNKMSTVMELKLNERFPKSLKKDHDILMMNYNANKSELKKKEFSLVVNDEKYKSKIYKNKKYRIIAPQEPSDVIKEGKAMANCVASYIDDIIKEKCKIYFMRSTENSNKSLITIEVRGDKIVQAKSFANRRIDDESRIFITEWANKRDLVENYY